MRGKLFNLLTPKILLAKCKIINSDCIIDFELNIYEANKPSTSGLHNEFLSS